MSTSKLQEKIAGYFSSLLIWDFTFPRKTVHSILSPFFTKSISKLAFREQEAPPLAVETGDRFESGAGNRGSGLGPFREKAAGPLYSGSVGAPKKQKRAEALFLSCHLRHQNLPPLSCQTWS
jgi:hypothetical protein